MHKGHRENHLIKFSIVKYYKVTQGTSHKTNTTGTKSYEPIKIIYCYRISVVRHKESLLSPNS